MPPNPPLLIAGATGYGAWPENSLEGALRCFEAPLDGIEIDVQLTADGHVVAHHDYRLGRSRARLDGVWLDAPTVPIKLMTLEELRRFDVGRARPGSKAASRYPHRQEMDGVRIPTLVELLRALKAAPGPRRLIYLEIKTDPANSVDAPAPASVVEAVVACLEAEECLDAAKVIAFDWQVPRLANARSPGIATAHLTFPSSLSPEAERDEHGRSPWTDGFDAIDHAGSDLRAIKGHGGMEWSPYFTEVNSKTVAEAKALGLKVGPWGLSAGDDIRRMRSFGVWSSTVSGPDWGF